MKMKNKIKKNFFWNVIGSTFNSATSLFFLILVTRINGVDDAGIFTFAFSTACVLQVIGLYAGRMYQVTETNENITDNDYIYNHLFSCLGMLLFAILFIFIKKYNLSKSMLILLLVFFKAIEAFSETLYAIIQKNDDLYKVGISLLIKGIMGIVAFALLDLFTKDLVVSIIGLILMNIVILIIYDVKNLRKYQLKLTKIRFTYVWHIFKFGFWTFLFTFLTQYVINSPKYAIDNFLSSEAQTIYGIIAMPATLMILCSQFLIHPFLVSLTHHLTSKDIKKFNQLIMKLVGSLVVFGIAANIVVYFIGIPFLELIYGISLKAYLKALLYIINGATLFGISYIFCSALTTMRETFKQVVIFGLDSIFAYFICNYFVKIGAVTGAATSYFCIMSFLLVLYVITYIIEINKYKRKCIYD